MPPPAMLRPVSLTRALGRSARILALGSALGCSAFVQAQGRPRAAEPPPIERSPVKESSRGYADGHSITDRGVWIKDVAPGWTVEEEQSTRKFGRAYSDTLRDTAESRFQKLVNTPIDI